MRSSVHHAAALPLAKPISSLKLLSRSTLSSQGDQAKTNQQQRMFRGQVATGLKTLLCGRAQAASAPSAQEPTCSSTHNGQHNKTNTRVSSHLETSSNEQKPLHKKETGSCRRRAQSSQILVASMQCVHRPFCQYIFLLA